MNSSRKSKPNGLSDTARTLRLLRMAAGLSTQEASAAFEICEEDLKSYESAEQTAPAHYLLALQSAKKGSILNEHDIGNDETLTSDISILTAAFSKINDQSLRRSIIAVVKAAAEKQ